MVCAGVVVVKMMVVTLELVPYAVMFVGAGRHGNVKCFDCLIIPKSEGSVVLPEGEDNVNNADRRLQELLLTEDGSLIGSKPVEVGAGHGTVG